MSSALPEPSTDTGASRPASTSRAEAVAPTPPLDPEFIQHFTRHQRQIYLYILTLLPNATDAEEVLQETNLVIWRKAGDFQPGTNFRAWACQIAYFEVLKFRDRRRRDRLQFSQEFVDALAEEVAARADLLERRRLALTRCLGKLRERDRELIQHRYAPGQTSQSVADLLGRPLNSIYQSLGRIRKALFECVNRELAAESRT